MGGQRWFINSAGLARFVSSSNSFKYWEIAGNVFRYYNLGGTHTITMSGDSGAITTPGAISSASLTTTGGITATATQTINFGANVPTTSGAPTIGNSLVNKTYADATYPTIGSVVNITGTQTISGLKTFSNTLTTTGGITATASQSISFGSNNPTMGASNINYGTAALRVGTGGSYSQKSIVIGPTAFSTATNSVAIGDSALNAATSSVDLSVAIGVNSLKLATDIGNTAIGANSLPLLTGTGNYNNTAIGESTGTKITTGSYNLFLGMGSGAGITSGVNNLIVGTSMYASVAGTGTGIDNNICIGSNAMGYIKNGTINNCAIGAYALYSELGYGGYGTVAVGPNAGVRSLGDNCVFVGNDASVDIPNSNYSNAMALGNGATVSASNQISIGTSSNSTIIKGSLKVDGTIGSGVTTTLGNIICGSITPSGDINAGSVNVYAGIMVCNRIDPANGIDIGGTLGKIQFTSALANIRIGQDTTVFTDSTVSNINIGNTSQALGGYNVCLGFNAKCGDPVAPLRGLGSIAIGANTYSNGSYSTIVGNGASANTEAVAAGRNSAAGVEGVACGKDTVATTQCVSIGSSALANSGSKAVAIGFSSLASGANSISCGQDSTASALNSISIGSLAVSSASNACTIGAGITNATADQLALGNSTHNIFVSQNYYPFEVSPTPISGNITISPPFYGVYNITATSASTITISGLTAATAGIQMLFRKTVNTVGTNIISASGFTYYPFNSVTAIGTSTAFIGSGQTVGRVAILNATQFMVAH